jgi:putative transposase
VPGTGRGANGHRFGTDPAPRGDYRRLVPRRPRDRGPGYFHVTTRGNNGDDVFRTVDDRRVFLVLMRKRARELEWVIQVWCLMTNHFHLIVATPQENLSAGMQRLNGLYAQWFNAFHGRTGHLFGRRFWSKRIENEEQLRTTAEYILDNPVRAGLCVNRWDWRWSGGPLAGDPAEPGSY